MELERISMVLRPRGPWEGLDLGFALARHWFLPLWTRWWILALPAAILCFLLTGARPDRWLLAIWWLKPVYEAPLLVWVSRALFGEPPSLRDLGATLGAGLNRRLLPYLLWRRLFPRRSFVMPLSLLEGLGGRAARARRRVLNGIGGTPAWLTLVCYHFEVILWGGVLLVLFLLVPQELPRLDLGAAVTDSASWAYWISVLAYLLAFSVVAPFYVCAGFALYLARRTELEAWDLELAFRRAREDQDRPRSAETIGGAARGRTLAAWSAAAFTTMLLTLVPHETVRADLLPAPEEARALIEEVLEARDFGSQHEIRIWVPVSRDEGAPDPQWVLPEGFGEAAVLLGHFFKWGLLGFAVIALGLLAFRILREWRPSGPRRPVLTPPLPASTSSSLRLEALPEDLAAAVRASLSDGDRRRALSLLYRASIVHLARLGLEIPAGTTENECLMLARRALPAPMLGPLEHLTRVWQGLAYGHLVPSRPLIETLLADWCRWTAAGGAKQGP